MTTSQPHSTDLLSPLFFKVAILNAVWINISEIFRYFVIVMPMMRKNLFGVPNVAPMNIPIFVSWAIWDLLLVGVVTTMIWLGFHRWGQGLTTAIGLATFAWLATFGIFWWAEFNLALASPGILVWALPLSWLELVMAALLMRWSMNWMKS